MEHTITIGVEVVDGEYKISIARSGVECGKAYYYIGIRAGMKAIRDAVHSKIWALRLIRRRQLKERGC